MNESTEKSTNRIYSSKCFTKTELNGRYEFIRRVYGSHTSFIAQCKHTNTGKKVAVRKILHINNKTDAKKVLRQIKILRALRGLDHITQLIDILPPQNFANFTQIIFVFEFLEADLSKLIHSDQYFSLQHVQYILYQILLALKYMHSLNIFHHNLQPTNILANHDVTVKISGSCLVHSMFANDNSIKYSGYVAPEIILSQQKREYYAEADMFNVGCIFAELLQMLQVNLHSHHFRKPLFPSYYNTGANKNASMEYIINICKITGTPAPDEILNFNDETIQTFLMQIPKMCAVDFTNMYPGCSQQILGLLRGLLQFDVEKRITVNEALAHPFIQHVRDEENEQRFEDIIDGIKHSDLLNFEFESMDLTMSMYRSLIIEEVLKYSRNTCQLVVFGYINRFYDNGSLLMPYDVIRLMCVYYVIDEI